MNKYLKNDELVKKVGGRFKLTALIQRRVKELVEGSRPLIDAPAHMSLINVAIQEIAEDKIGIDYEKTEGIRVPENM